jgi:hypothetical protein
MGNDGRDPHSLVGALKEVFADLKALVQSELRLAKAEMSLAIGGTIKAGAFMAASGLVAFVALIFLLQAAVFGLAALGLGLGWASLVMGVVLALIAAGVFFYGRSLARPLTPERTIRQIDRDLAAVREQLT